MKRVAGTDKFSSRPCLVGFAHRATGFAMGPFVELPFIQHAEFVQFSEPVEFTQCQIAQAQLVDKPDPVTTDKRPDAAVVVMIRQV